MKIKTATLTDLALDWAVAESEGNVRLQYDSREGLIIRNILGWIPYRPSVAWVQGGPIIERECIATYASGACSVAPKNPDCWVAEILATEEMITQYGPTPLVATMRCFVASKLGDEVDVPEELCVSAT